MPLKDIPIRQKLTLVILMTCGVVLLLTCTAFITYEVITLRKNMVRGYTTQAVIIADNSTASLAFQNESDAADVLGALKSDPRTIKACIYDNRGKVFATYPAGWPAKSFPAVPARSGYRYGKSSLEIFCPIIQSGRTLGTVYLQSDLSALTDSYRAYALLAAMVLAGSLLVAFLLARAFQKEVSEPVLALAETARVISKDRDFSVRAKKLSNDEIGLLTDAFNQMLAEIHKLNATLEQRVEERTKQLEAANKELEAFSYSVSHDLRAPLRHIDGFVDLLRQDAQQNLNASGQRYLTIISEAAKRMGALIDDLLVFSRMGRSEMRRTDVRMDELVSEVLKEMAQDLQNKTIEWDIAPLPVTYGDRAMLKQVWVNLLSNAVKYSQHRSPAKIKVKCLENGSAEREFSVQDNGAGFDMQYAGKLFGVFQRLHQAEEFEGTGIGLANVQRIILRHGGRVWAQGEVDAGATFYFTLPKNTPERKNIKT